MREIEESSSATDIVPHSAEFVVQRALFVTGQAAAMLAGHVVGFLADAAQTIAQAIGTIRVDIALRLANVDAVEFFREAALHLIKAGARVHRRRRRNRNRLVHHHRT